ncbi:hypothetical protein B0T22DRAFT_9008 [Podospora appendiculata]|uniref:Uncharacterized protein n=1 Tax=Podospora appendiculata TaxID=314037 RepID=A0AAE0XF73_9PEZI|nr:hypothetical protein B0T22DRAFT_9008 [Podospora appendiculata]
MDLMQATHALRPGRPTVCFWRSRTQRTNMQGRYRCTHLLLSLPRARSTPAPGRYFTDSPPSTRGQELTYTVPGLDMCPHLRQIDVLQAPACAGRQGALRTDAATELRLASAVRGSLSFGQDIQPTNEGGHLLGYGVPGGMNGFPEVHARPVGTCGAYSVPYLRAELRCMMLQTSSRMCRAAESTTSPKIMPASQTSTAVLSSSRVHDGRGVKSSTITTPPSHLGQRLWDRPT